VFALQQYRPISQVYRPSDDAPADDVRIAMAQRSWLYGHLADRLSGTLAPRGQRRLTPFREIVFEMLDPSLMAAWASAHDENCDPGRASHLRARMVEFGWAVPPPPPTRGNEQASCPADPAVLGYRDFR
jgi:hypothetical protein